MSKISTSLLLAFSLGVAIVPQAWAWTLPDAELPLGSAGLQEERSATDVAPGVQHIHILRGGAAESQFWTIEIGFAATDAAAQELEEKLVAAGLEPRRDPSTFSLDGKPLGHMIRSGQFATAAEAADGMAALVAAGLKPALRFTGEDGGAAQGPFVVDILAIDPSRFEGSVQAALAADTVAGRETTSSIAQRLDAIAAVNGGYFVVNETGGTPGDPAGISVIDGQVVSEAVNGRPALRLGTQFGILPDMRSDIALSFAGGATLTADGLNRQPGLSTNCGNPGDTPLATPAHDLTCTDADEIVIFTPAFGAPLPSGPGFQARFAADGALIAAGPALGGPMPAEGFVVQATGSQAEALAEAAKSGATASFDIAVSSAGETVSLGEGDYLVNGGPTLVATGVAVAKGPTPEGWSPDMIGETDRNSFFNGWFVRRNPRTAAGVTADGWLLLVTVDGRRPEHSLGASIPEMGALLAALGAKDAINLDGGGSTAMVIGQKLIGVPSDATGERPDADAIVLLGTK